MWESVDPDLARRRAELERVRVPEHDVGVGALGELCEEVHVGKWLARAPRVAVVGTRQYTPLGERVTRRVVAALAEVGAVVVSGLARGIDTVAPAAALAEGLPTAAVLGTGVDVPYPPQNTWLHGRIAESGCVAAEPPPGTGATPGAFPRRNRIVAALAEADWACVPPSLPSTSSPPSHCLSH